MILLARLYRRSDAAKYLGMSVYLFDRLARPHLTEIRISAQAVAFDRIELDALAEHYKQANGPEQQ